MTTDLLAICVGNTNTRVGTFVDDVLAEAQVVPNRVHALGRCLPTAYEPIRRRAQPVVLVSSTNPPVAARVHDLVKSELGVTAARVEQDVPVPIGRQLDPEAIVGDDRLLNGAAAYDVLRQACVIVDAGTAVTVDFVDGAGTFHGGAIAPGVRLMLEALVRGAAQLPDVDMAAPVEAIGHNTVQAIRSGIFHGLRGMVRELTEQYAEFAGAYPVVIATGGDAELLFDGYDLVDRIVPDLILLGMRLTLRGPG